MRKKNKPRDFEFPSMQEYWAGKKRLAAITDAAPQHFLASLLKEKLWECDRLSAFHDYAMETVREMQGPSSDELRQWLLDAGTIAVQSAYESLRPQVMRAIKQERALKAGRSSGRAELAKRSSAKRVKALESAARFLEGHGLADAEDVIKHVSSDTGLSPGSVRRYLGNITKLRRRIRDDYKKDRESRIAAAGRLRG